MNGGRIDRTCLTYWYPKVVAAGLPSPDTTIILAKHDDIGPILDGEETEGFKALVAAIQAAADAYGYPAFLRTGQTSAKHYWRDTCFLPSAEAISKHVYGIIEFSCLCDFRGLAFDVWVVRRFLSLAHEFTAFEGMPVAREWRAFIGGGAIKCVHPYWPSMAIEGHNPSEPDWQTRLARAYDGGPSEMALDLLNQAASAFAGDGEWSVDICQDTAGKWWLTDMAEAHRSFHWEGCENKARPTP